MILKAVTSDNAEMRYMVGNDANQLMEAKKRMSGQEFEDSLNNSFFLVNNNNNNNFFPALTQPVAKLEVNSTNRQIHMEAYILNCPMKTT